MNAVVFITDTHLGAVGGFCQQPRRLERLADFSAWIRREPPALVLHGGDVTHHGTPAQVAAAAALFGEWGVPVAVALGNHDLVAPGALERWQAVPGLRLADTVVPVGAWDVVLLNNAWCVDGVTGFAWREEAIWHETLLDRQLDWLARRLAGNPARPAALVVHAPLDPVPARLAGREIHPPHASYAAALRAVLDRAPRVKVVLSGHNHVMTATTGNGRTQLSTASLTEVPFSCRRLWLGATGYRYETVSLPGRADDPPGDATREWVAGQEVDRQAARGV